MEGSVQAGSEFCKSSSGGSPAGTQMALAASASATREREACSGSARRWARENVVWRIRWPPDMEGKLAPASTPGSSAMRLCSKVPVELTACAESSFHQHTPSSTSQLSQTSISTYLAWHDGSTPRILRVGHPTRGSCGWLATACTQAHWQAPPFPAPERYETSSEPRVVLPCIRTDLEAPALRVRVRRTVRRAPWRRKRSAPHGCPVTSDGARRTGSRHVDAHVRNVLQSRCYSLRL